MRGSDIEFNQTCNKFTIPSIGVALFGLAFSARRRIENVLFLNSGVCEIRYRFEDVFQINFNPPPRIVKVDDDIRAWRVHGHGTLFHTALFMKACPRQL